MPEPMLSLDLPAVLRERDALLRTTVAALLRFEISRHTQSVLTIERAAVEFVRELQSRGIELRRRRVAP